MAVLSKNCDTNTSVTNTVGQTAILWIGKGYFKNSDGLRLFPFPQHQSSDKKCIQSQTCVVCMLKVLPRFFSKMSVHAQQHAVGRGSAVLELSSHILAFHNKDLYRTVDIKIWYEGVTW